MEKKEKREAENLAKKQLEEKLKKEEEERIKIFQKIMEEKQGVRAEEVEMFREIYGDPPEGE